MRLGDGCRLMHKGQMWNQMGVKLRMLTPKMQALLLVSVQGEQGSLTKTPAAQAKAVACPGTSCAFKRDPLSASMLVGERVRCRLIACPKELSEHKYVWES